MFLLSFVLALTLERHPRPASTPCFTLVRVRLKLTTYLSPPSMPDLTDDRSAAEAEEESSVRAIPTGSEGSRSSPHVPDLDEVLCDSSPEPADVEVDVAQVDDDSETKSSISFSPTRTSSPDDQPTPAAATVSVISELRVSSVSSLCATNAWRLLCLGVSLLGRKRGMGID